jgi:hypothetical protein
MNHKKHASNVKVCQQKQRQYCNVGVSALRALAALYKIEIILLVSATLRSQGKKG